MFWKDQAGINEKIVKSPHSFSFPASKALICRWFFEWQLSELSAGNPFYKPQLLFQKLDPEVADEEYNRLG